MMRKYSNVVTSSGPSKSPRVDYSFMVVPTESFTSKSSEFLAMIQHVISSTSSFTSCLEFIPESNLPLSRFVVCHPKHPIYLLFPSLGVMPRILTALHLSFAHDDDITRQLANCDENYKFVAYPYSIL